MDNYNLSDTFTKVLGDIEQEHNMTPNTTKKKPYSETDYLFMAFMSLLKAYMARMNTEPSNPVTIMGA